MAPRLAPLYIASALQWMNFWVGTDKPFMQSIGFTPTLIGLAGSLSSWLLCCRGSAPSRR